MAKTKEKPVRTSSGSEIGERLRDARHARGWSQAQLAKYAGVSQQGIAAIEMGATSLPRFLPQIAQAAGVDMEWLRTGRGRGPHTQSGNLGTLLREIPVVRASQALQTPAPVAGERMIALGGNEVEQYGPACAVQVGIDARDLVRQDGPFQGGDILILDRACAPEPGDYCLASMPGDQPGFGRLRLREDMRWELVPENDMFPVRVLDDGDQIVAVVREIRRAIR